MALVDLNSDVGEAYGQWPGGPDELLVPHLTSVNVACGFHAGDPSTIRRTCELAVAHGCVIGAQVSYPDLVGFGRRFIDMEPSELADAVTYQIGALDAFARSAGSEVRFVKPHGALYNAIVRRPDQADAVVAGMLAIGRPLPLLCLPNSSASVAADSRGVRAVGEGFADRAYADDGSLVPRTQPGALLTDPAAAARAACRLVDQGVRSICVHSDTPGSPDIVRAVAAALQAAGHELRAFAT